MKNATWYWEWTTDTTEDAVEIVYNYDAGDAGVMYYSDGSGCPPEPPSVELVRMKYKGVDVTELLFTVLPDQVFEELELEICDHVQDGGLYDPEDFKE